MATKVCAKIISHSSPDVYFETLSDGDWFLYLGYLGVKTQGKGFYPAGGPYGGIYGTGNGSILVQPVNKIVIRGKD